MRVKGLLVAASLVLALAATACGGDDGGDGGGGGGGDGVTLSIVDFSFDPQNLSVATGGSVSVTNNGEATHTFTVTDQGVEAELAPGASEDVAIDLAAGAYPFMCEFHPAMTGTLTVT